MIKDVISTVLHFLNLLAERIFFSMKKIQIYRLLENVILIAKKKSLPHNLVDLGSKE